MRGELKIIWILFVFFSVFVQAQIPTERPAQSTMDFYLSIDGAKEIKMDERVVLYRNFPKDYYSITLHLGNFPPYYAYSVWLFDSLMVDSVLVIANRADTLLSFNFQPPTGFKDSAVYYFAVVPNGFGPTFPWSLSGAVVFSTPHNAINHFSFLRIFIILSASFFVSMMMVLGKVSLTGVPVFNLRYYRTNGVFFNQFKNILRQHFVSVLKIIIPLTILFQMFYYKLFAGPSKVALDIEYFISFVIFTILPVSFIQLLTLLFVVVKDNEVRRRENIPATMDELLVNMIAFDHGEHKGMLLLRLQFLLRNFDNLLEDYKARPMIIVNEIITLIRQVSDEVLPTLYRIVLDYQLVSTVINNSFPEKNPKTIRLISEVRLLSSESTQLLGNSATEWCNDLSAMRLIVSKIINSIDFIQLGYGEIKKQVTDNFKCSLKEIVDFLDNSYKKNPILEHNNLQFQVVQLCNSDCFCLFNRTELTEVLSIIIGNSVEELLSRDGEDKTISVTISAVNDKVIITISDNGGGIPPHIVNNVLNYGFSTKGSNRGKGLFIAGKYLKKFNATMKIENQLPTGTKTILEIKRLYFD